MNDLKAEKEPEQQPTAPQVPFIPMMQFYPQNGQNAVPVMYAPMNYYPVQQQQQ